MSVDRKGEGWAESVGAQNLAVILGSAEEGGFSQSMGAGYRSAGIRGSLASSFFLGGGGVKQTIK